MKLDTLAKRRFAMALWSYLLPPRRYEVAARASLGRLGSAPRLSPALRAISDPSEHLYSYCFIRAYRPKDPMHANS